MAAFGEGRASARGRVANGQLGVGRAPGELWTLGNQSENFAAAAGEGARGAAVRPPRQVLAAAGGCGCSPAGGLPRGLGFCLAPLPLPSQWGDRQEGGSAASRVSDPHALPPKGAPRLSSSSCPPHWSGSLPLPKMAARPRRWEGDCIRRPPLALPFFPSRPFLLRLDAPPHPQPSRAGGWAMGGEWPDRVEPIQLYCSTRDTSSAARPPLRQAN